MLAYAGDARHADELLAISIADRPDHDELCIRYKFDELLHNRSDALGTLVWMQSCRPNNGASFQLCRLFGYGQAQGVGGGVGALVESGPNGPVRLAQTDYAVSETIGLRHFYQIGIDIVQEEQGEQALHEYERPEAVFFAEDQVEWQGVREPVGEHHGISFCFIDNALECLCALAVTVPG